MGTSDDNREAVRTAFEHWERGDSGPFFALVADDVRWTVIGTTAISGTYTSKRAFVTGPVADLTSRFTSPLRAEIVDVSAEGEKVFLQWKGSATTAGGFDYAQTYCWVLTMRDGSIVEATAYLDTALVEAVLAETT